MIRMYSVVSAYNSFDSVFNYCPSCSNGSVYEHGARDDTWTKIHKINLKNLKLVGVQVESSKSMSGITVVSRIGFLAKANDDDFNVNFGPYGAGCGDHLGAEIGIVKVAQLGNIKAIAGRSGGAIDQIKFLGTAMCSA